MAAAATADPAMSQRLFVDIRRAYGRTFRAACIDAEWPGRGIRYMLGCSAPDGSEWKKNYTARDSGPLFFECEAGECMGMIGFDIA